MTETTTELSIHLEFIEPLLGTASGNPEVQEEFIASKAPNLAKRKEELEDSAVPEEIEKKSTIFARDDTGLHLWDYQLRGFFKESLIALVETGRVTGVTRWTLKKAVDSLLFVEPRRIYLLQPNSSEPWKEASLSLQRPIRAETMRGERIALGRSEMLVGGTHVNFNVLLLNVSNTRSKWRLTVEDIKTALNYGRLKGLGQWRSGGWGRFTYTAK